MWEIFRQLSKRQDIPLVDIGRREYAYLPLLSHMEGDLVLSRLMAEAPEFFVSILCDVFRPDSGETSESDESSKKRASIRVSTPDQI